MSKQEKYGLDKHLVRFSTEKECYDYLFSVKWGAKPKCPSCGNTHMNYYISTRKTYKCSRCYKQFSLIQGTIFEKSRIPLTKWFIAIYFFTTNKRGISSIQLSKWLGVTQRTAWFMLHRLREALKEENNIILSGVVEADETFIGPNISRDRRLQVTKAAHEKIQKQNNIFSTKKLQKIAPKVRGRKKGETKEVLLARKSSSPPPKPESKFVQYENLTVVFGMLEREGRLVLKRLGNSIKTINRKKIYPIMQQHISASSIVITDQNIIYNGIEQMYSKHWTINHNETFVNGDIHTNNIENAWKHLKKFIDGTYFHVSERHFDRYLDEYTYRWNRRQESDKRLFESFVPFLVKSRLSYLNLTNKSENRMAA